MLLKAIASVSLLAILACRTELIVEGGGGQGGEPSNGGAPATGGEASGGAPSTGAFGPGGGGAGPEPIAGCEQLAWAGEPVILPGLWHPSRARLAALDGGSVGVVYDDYDNGGDNVDKVLSQTLSGAFDAWPPPVSDPVIHHSGMVYNELSWLSARGDGTFALSGFHLSGIFRFDDPQPIVADPFLRTYVLEPEAGGGAYVVDYVTGGPPFATHFASVDPLAGASDLGELELADDCGTFYGSVSAGAPLLVFGSRHYCFEQSKAPTATFFSLGAAGELVESAAFELPFFPVKQHLEPRLAGFFYPVSSEIEGVTGFPIDAAGEPQGPPAIEASGDTRWPHDMAAWRDGYAVLHREFGPSPNWRMSLSLHQGESVTQGPGVDLFLSSTRSEAPMVVSPTGTSVLVAIETIEGIQLHRADCVPATE